MLARVCVWRFNESMRYDDGIALFHVIPHQDHTTHRKALFPLTRSGAILSADTGTYSACVCVQMHRFCMYGNARRHMRQRCSYFSHRHMKKIIDFNFCASIANLGARPNMTVNAFCEQRRYNRKNL